MSESQVRVVRINNIEKHANADSLSITQVDGGYPVIFRTGDFNVGDLAVYIPVDSVVPQTDEFKFLGKNTRIKAKRLRGVFSMGLLVAARPGMREGDVVDQQLGIEKYEPDIEAEGKGRKGAAVAGGETERDPGFIPVYTDIEGFRKYGRLFEEIIGDKPVIISEKVHGTNCRYMYDSRAKKLWVGSHNKIKRSPFYSETRVQRGIRLVAAAIFWVCRKLTVLCRWSTLFSWAKNNRAREIPDNLWSAAARKYNLQEKLQQFPGIVFYGEIFGQVQDLKYGAKKDEIFLHFFDAYDVAASRYVNWDDLEHMVKEMGLDTVPVLYRGPWTSELTGLRNGGSLIAGAEHVREGFVVKPVVEMFHPRLRRVILKYVGEDYLLR